MYIRVGSSIVHDVLYMAQRVCTQGCNSLGGGDERDYLLKKCVLTDSDLFIRLKKKTYKRWTVFSSSIKKNELKWFRQKCYLIEV